MNISDPLTDSEILTDISPSLNFDTVALPNGFPGNSSLSNFLPKDQTKLSWNRDDRQDVNGGDQSDQRERIRDQAGDNSFSRGWVQSCGLPVLF